MLGLTFGSRPEERGRARGGEIVSKSVSRSPCLQHVGLDLRRAGRQAGGTQRPRFRGSDARDDTTALLSL